MRRDENLGLGGTSVQVAGDRTTPKNGGSFSGHERDKLFLSDFGNSFKDVSGVSGLDHDGDGRSSSFFDFDRDGFPDFALASANAPLLQIFRNQLGEIQERPNRFVAVRFIGGNQGAEASAGLSPRDGYGARVKLRLGERTILRSHLLGQGFASQNSPVMLIGLGDRERADQLEVLWPGGRSVSLENVAAGTLVSAFEGGPDSEARLELSAYGAPIASGSSQPKALDQNALARRVSLPDPQGQAGLRMYTSMTTTCVNCIRELPRLAEMRALFAPDQLSMYGLPVDLKDRPQDLESYWSERQPSYERIDSLDTAATTRIVERMIDELGSPSTPSTMVLNADGDLLLVKYGMPTVSEIRRLLEAQP